MENLKIFLKQNFNFFIFVGLPKYWFKKTFFKESAMPPALL